MLSRPLVHGSALRRGPTPSPREGFGFTADVRDLGLAVQSAAEILFRNPRQHLVILSWIKYVIVFLFLFCLMCKINLTHTHTVSYIILHHIACTLIKPFFFPHKQKWCGVFLNVKDAGCKSSKIRIDARRADLGSVLGGGSPLSLINRKLTPRNTIFLKKHPTSIST